MCFEITHILSITYGILALFYAKFRLGGLTTVGRRQLNRGQTLPKKNRGQTRVRFPRYFAFHQVDFMQPAFPDVAHAPSVRDAGLVTYYDRNVSHSQ
jgi:hypothetical protein